MHDTLDLIYVPTKLSQTVWELRPAQDIGFRGDKYVKKKVIVVSLAHGTSSGPYKYYQNISNH